MADLHIEDFYRDVATIFLRLYAVFPRKTTLYVEDVSGPDQPDEFGLHNPRFQAAFSAIVWLADHGYLYFNDTIREEAVDQVVLSQRAFLLLSAPAREPVAPPVEDSGAPSVIAESQTALTQLRYALRQGSSLDIKQAVSDLLSRPPIGGL
ncbi:hypothetical protein [Parahaliea mediterranea]|uniref:Uncharacterized protein n=1 Tax=Parahaliea mediterranea TaxID=651086 RepID=A0A939IKK5_9GAMM|nr:hypothetical protein [Parahaliea mediterranea]MBN7798854.1 hypothetical protein [Parahaliea mediterranea]